MAKTWSKRGAKGRCQWCGKLIWSAREGRRGEHDGCRSAYTTRNPPPVPVIPANVNDRPNGRG